MTVMNFVGSLLFSAEPTLVPTGDECEHDSPERCGKSDCPDHGRRVAALLRAAALMSVPGMIALAREVCRVVDAYGANVPDDAVTRGDLGRACARLHGNKWSALDAATWAWTDGVCEALTGVDHAVVTSAGVMVAYRTAAENDAHVAGVEYVKQWLVEKAGVTSAVGAVSAPLGTPTLRHRATADEGPGFESRAQREPSSAERDQARRRVRGS